MNEEIKVGSKWKCDCNDPTCCAVAQTGNHFGFDWMYWNLCHGRVTPYQVPAPTIETGNHFWGITQDCTGPS